MKVAARLRTKAETLTTEAQNARRSGADRGTQILLRLRYKEMPNLPFGEIEFRNFSQNGEDGILLYLFSLLEVVEGRAVEICAGHGIECNSANLVVHWGWEALWLDGSPDLVARGRNYFRRIPETMRLGAPLEQAWVTRENVGSLLRDRGFTGPVDLLSMDMDGMDYWIVRELIQGGHVNPSVVVVEYQNRIPADRAITVPYSEDFDRQSEDPRFGQGYFGASLLAYQKLLTGHKLVGANRENTNAFFLRNGLTDLPEVSVESCLQSRWATVQRERWWSWLQKLEWIEV